MSLITRHCGKIELPCHLHAEPIHWGIGLTQSTSQHLLEIAEAYRAMAPGLSYLRRYVLRGHTLLPNSLSPIVPAIAFGYKKTCHDALRILGEQDFWRTHSKNIADSYRLYCDKSDNALLWAGWNYWKPAATSTAFERVIQVIVAEDNELVDAVRNDLPVLELDGSALSRRELQLVGARRRGGETLSFEEMTKESGILVCRDFAEGVWHQVFTRSVERFLGKGLKTIVDFHRDDIRRVIRNPHDGSDEEQKHQTAVGMPFAVHFGESEVPTNSRGVSIGEATSEALWTWTQELSRQSSGETPETRLIDTWMLASSVFEEELGSVPELVHSAVRRVADQLMISEDRLAEAFVILLHFCWFNRAMLSRYQYSMPISFGEHVCVMFLSTRNPLPPSELSGWQQIATQLFGSIFVEHLTEIALENERRRYTDEQRLMLSHSLPKFIFKPAEYFAFRIESIASAEEIDTKELRKLAEVLPTLLSRGQTELIEYTRFGESLSSFNAQPLNLFHVCKKLSSIFQEVCKFHVAGRIDRNHKIKRKLSLRAKVLSNCKMTVNSEEGERDIANMLVDGNPSIITAHLWNVIDNAFRFSDIRESGVKIAFNLSLFGEETVVLKATNTGQQIGDRLLAVLNRLFEVPSDTDEFRRIEQELKFLKENERDYGLREIEQEHSGRGLCRFSGYLDALWTPRIGIGHRRAEITSGGGVNTFSFHFPRHKVEAAGRIY